MTYTVNLTEEERNEALAGGLPPWLRRNIKSVRPEHPERQPTLEELAQWMLAHWEIYDSGLALMVDPAMVEGIESRLEKLRSLEGK
jgi:hypothetical protein